MKIDVHGHTLFAEAVGKAGKWGPRYEQDGATGRWKLVVGPYEVNLPPQPDGVPFDPMEDMRKNWDPAGIVTKLDDAGVDMAALTISPLFYFYWAETEIAIPFCQLQNDLMARDSKRFSDRLFFLATLPMQDPAAAVAEVRRAAALGAKGVNLGTDDFGGRNFDDEAYWPVYEALQEHDLPIFIHPYPSPMATGKEDRYNLSWVLGYCYSESVAFAHFTLGGVLDAFPRLKIYITHGGGMTPYQLGRLEQARTTGQPGVKAQKAIYDYMPNFYFDVLVHDLKARQFLYDLWGADNLVVGSNRGGWDWADGFKLLDELNLSAEEHEKIAWKNAARLFNLDIAKVPA
jgi:aminocarboxymuconate-semialdehyde decarboxylase